MSKLKIRHCLYTIFGVLASLLAGIACTKKEGEFFFGSLKGGEYRILISNITAGTLTVNLYDIEGKLIKILADFTADNLSPRGLAATDMFSFLVALDGTDQIKTIDLTGASSTYISNTNLNGNIYQMRRHPNGEILVIESNTIESFVESGTRVGNPRINTTIAPCVLNVPRGMDVLPSGEVVVVGTGNDDINIYNISTSTATCVRANTGFAGTVDPFAVLAHSDGNIYVATQGNDSIYQFPSTGTGAGTVIFNTLAVINNPTALLEMPDGSILVASDGTNSIERIDTAGNRIGSTPFIIDGFTGSISDMILLPPEEE